MCADLCLYPVYICIYVYILFITPFPPAFPHLSSDLGRGNTAGEPLGAPFMGVPGTYILNKTQVTRTTHEPPHNRTHERNTRPNHLAAIGGCATTVRATSHAWVGGRAEVSMGSRVVYIFEAQDTLPPSNFAR